LLEKVKGNMEHFHRRGSQNARHLGARLPTELMLLGSPRCLGRGWTFDDLAEVHVHAQLIFPSRFMCCLRPSPPPSFAWATWTSEKTRRKCVVPCLSCHFMIFV
jgi:hypothetical protein